jgi:hypothetical protein
MQEHVIKTYSFGELSEEAQQTALEKNYDINVDFEDWSECIIDDATEIGALMGIEIKNVYFNGFWSQGDGACFEGNYEYRKGSVKAVCDYAPVDLTLHRIVKCLQVTQRLNFYQLNASITQSGHYTHEGCTAIDVLRNYNSATLEATEDISELLRDFMRWIYKQLEQEYAFQTEAEQIKDTIIANDLQFNADGSFNTCY